MGKLLRRLRRYLRTAVQFCFTALTNGYAAGFARGTIWKGASKQFCVPGLNCYSCPGALGACPIGSFQAVLSDRNYHFAFYVAGFLLVVGALFGRFVCGWLCPFGLVQDLLHRNAFVDGLLNQFFHDLGFAPLEVFGNVCQNAHTAFPFLIILG